MTRATTALLLLACTSCGSQRPSRTPEQIAQDCAPLAKVEANFVAELLEACEEYDGDPEHPERCPGFDDIDARYQPLRVQAVRSCDK